MASVLSQERKQAQTSKETVKREMFSSGPEGQILAWIREIRFHALEGNRVSGWRFELAAQAPEAASTCLTQAAAGDGGPRTHLGRLPPGVTLQN